MMFQDGTFRHHAETPSTAAHGHALEVYTHTNHTHDAPGCYPQATRTFNEVFYLITGASKKRQTMRCNVSQLPYEVSNL